jgi:hypothetical protein
MIYCSWWWHSYTRTSALFRRRDGEVKPTHPTHKKHKVYCMNQSDGHSHSEPLATHLTSQRHDGRANTMTRLFPLRCKGNTASPQKWPNNWIIAGNWKWEPTLSAPLSTVEANVNIVDRALQMVPIARCICHRNRALRFESWICSHLQVKGTYTFGFVSYLHLQPLR